MMENSARTAHRILAVHSDSSALRLMRETLEQFANCTVDSSPQAEYAFELALQRTYSLFLIFDQMPVISGELLYGLISKAYTHCHAGARTCPPVIYLSADHQRRSDLMKEARVKDVIPLPLSIQRLLEAVKGVIPL